MDFIIVTYHFVTPMYFMEHSGSGFAISTDRQQAKIYQSRQLAEKEAERLTFISGMKAEVKLL